MRFSLNIFAWVPISVGKFLFPESMFEEVFELPLVSLSVFHHMNSITGNFSIIPLPHITFVLEWFPIATPIFLTVGPLPGIILSIFPKVFPFSVSFVVFELSFISAYIRFLDSYFLFPIDPFSLKNGFIFDGDSLAMPFWIFSFSEIELFFFFSSLVFIKYDLEVFFFYQFLNFYFNVLWDVVANELWNVFLQRNLLQLFLLLN